MRLGSAIVVLFLLYSVACSAEFNATECVLTSPFCKDEASCCGGYINSSSGYIIDSLVDMCVCDVEHMCSWFYLHVYKRLCAALFLYITKR